MSLSLTLLGDVRAESDLQMLSRVFLETPDYRSLVAATEGRIVVGRRGTGKSALMHRLESDLVNDKQIILLSIAPDDDQIIGLRPLLAFFGEKFTRIRAGVRLVWRYAVILELLERLSHKYKVKELIDSNELISSHLRKWTPLGHDIFSRMKLALRGFLVKGLDPEDQIGDLATKLNLRELEAELKIIVDRAGTKCIVLIDRLDEGYEYDSPGIALIAGVVYGLTDLNSSINAFRPIVFLRDNIFRSIAVSDPDFSRNIEGQASRLHWDTYQLFNMVCSRLRVAFSLNIENNQRVWDRCTANELQRQDGFKKCLQLTLYRPRDILILLNQAFYNAGKQDRDQIVLSDIESAAKSISESRFTDLLREYEIIFHGLPLVTAAFKGRNPELTVLEAVEILSRLIGRDEFSPDIQQEFAVFRDPIDQLRNLYSIGFIGIHDKDAGSYTFCHDGKQPDREFNADDRILVHPCYWLALSLTKNTLNPEEAEEINDEYDITVTSITPQIRSHKLGKIIADLDSIPLAIEGAAQFEDWCEEAIRIAFAGHLRNVKLHPNRDAVQRRDVVATNLSTKGVWKRIYEDYKTRQVIFEVKNYEGIGINEYRQMHSYLCDDYGRLGFIVTRDASESLSKDRELVHFLEMYHKHQVMIVKLTGRYLCTMLSKLRNPKKHDEPDNLLHKLLDRYSRMYLSGVGGTAARKKRGKR